MVVTRDHCVGDQIVPFSWHHSSPVTKLLLIEQVHISFFVQLMGTVILKGSVS